MGLPFLYINGYPGVGKLTVAQELCKSILNSKVINNHCLIDPVAMVYDRAMTEHQPLHRAFRMALLDSIARSVETRDVVWICTDQQSSDVFGSMSATDYYQAASSRGSRSISVILTREAQENERRLKAAGRGGLSNTKLTDVGILREIRDTEDLYHFGGKDELELDVTAKSAGETARLVVDFISRT